MMMVFVSTTLVKSHTLEHQSHISHIMLYKQQHIGMLARQILNTILTK